MAVAGARDTSPPTPEECSHPHPVTGVMAHEFSHYEGAIGPEGTRRTSTFYGPVIGGLPIRAWHCETCGLLRLDFPDGRKEERRLFPGYQPGLLAELSPVQADRMSYGLQARVSGLTAQPRLFEQLVEDAGLMAAPLQLPRIVLPAWDAATWLIVAALSAIACALMALGVLAVYTTSTPSVVQPLTVIVVFSFVGVIVFAVGVAAVRHFFPGGPLSPSVAVSARGVPTLSTVTKTVVALLVLSLCGFFAAGVLAVYWYATPGAEWPVFLCSIALAVTATVVIIVDAAVRHWSRR
ncbi:MAG TPA: hypothetical protein VJU79_05080 [Candidatus Dormibacteraeota bacterium]|nr:hypothetical protein [Candidatus Dormibacteraeota bacterium]